VISPWPEAVERVAAFLRAAGAEARLEEFEVGTPTAEAAADAIGCTLGQVVKSLVLVCDGKPLVALVPGDRKGSTPKIARAVGGRHARVARPAEVVAATGFEPGAVAPFALSQTQPVLLERLLLRHRLVWCGAGSARHMTALAPAELQRLTGADIVDIVADEEAETPGPERREA
jgi:prolyl-tRNA editing enzyme YbaK/EbsC (Cys-tRNA(Pro) deacylase)